MNPMRQDVWDFQTKFAHLYGAKHPTYLHKSKLRERVECMEEELGEFKEACEKQDLPGQADALIDLVYFALGTANMLGLPWEDLWADVQRANMSKMAGIGKRGHKIDCIKPNDWLPPFTEEILLSHGWVKAEADDERLHNRD